VPTIPLDAVVPSVPPFPSAVPQPSATIINKGGVCAALHASDEKIMTASMIAQAAAGKGIRHRLNHNVKTAPSSLSEAAQRNSLMELEMNFRKMSKANVQSDADRGVAFAEQDATTSTAVEQLPSIENSQLPKIDFLVDLAMIPDAPNSASTKNGTNGTSNDGLSFIDFPQGYWTGFGGE